MKTEHAEKEFEILEKTVPDAIILPFKKEILALVDAFMNSGQSGGSAPYTSKAISQAVEHLSMFQTITPLTGEDDEWIYHDEHSSKPFYQNKRNSAVFKDEKDGPAHYLNAIVFDGDLGGGFTGSATFKGRRISSVQQIKEFPFTPKTFYVDVKDYRWAEEGLVEIPEGHWWTHEIIDEEQLKEVFEYYDLYEKE